MTSPESTRQFFAEKVPEYPVQSAPYELASVLAIGILTSDRRRQIIEAHGLTGDPALHALLLDWILDYVRHALVDRPLGSEVADAVAPLKHALGITEGDFLALRSGEIKAILSKQLDRILEDGVLDDQEELAQSALQRVFDLGYDQYLALTRPKYELALLEINEALANADPQDVPVFTRRRRSLLAVCELAVTQPRSLVGLR